MRGDRVLHRRESNLRIYIPAADIRRRLPGFIVDRVYDVRATLTLDVGRASQSGYWSDEFIAGVFPVRDRSHAIIRRAAF
jgi:hypothetical protein